MSDRNSNPDLILRDGRVATLDRANPLASAVAISKGKFVAVGSDQDVMNLAVSDTQVIDLNGRRVLLVLSTITCTSFAAVSTSIWSCAGTACEASLMRWRC